MIEWLASNILKFAFDNSKLSSDIKDIYQYGIEISLSSALNIVLILIVSLIVGNLFAGILFLVIFIFFRSFTGGYHAPTYFKCNFYFVLAFLLTCFFYKLFSLNSIGLLELSLLGFVNLIPIYIFSPVPNVHKPLTVQITKRNRILAISIATLFTLFGLLLIDLDIEYGYMFIVTISAISVMMIIEIILQRRRNNGI